MIYCCLKIQLRSPHYQTLISSGMQERQYLNVPYHFKLSTYKSIQSHQPFHQFQPPTPSKKYTPPLVFLILFKVTVSKSFWILRHLGPSISCTARTWLLTKSSNVGVRGISASLWLQCHFPLPSSTLATVLPISQLALYTAAKIIFWKKNQSGPVSLL